MRILLFLRRRKKSNKSAGYGKSSHESSDLMESPQPLVDNKNAFDSVYVSFGNKDGARIVCRTSYRKGNKSEICLLIHIPDKGYYEIPTFPDTSLYNCLYSKKSFKVGDLQFTCIEPMKKWLIHFDGLLRKGQRLSHDEPIGELVHCKLWIIWKAGFPFYNYDTDMDPKMISEGIAKETWTKEMFENMEK